MDTTPAIRVSAPTLPPLLTESDTPAMRSRVERFYLSAFELFTAWLHRCRSVHTRRTYQAAIMHFVRFQGIRWPDEAWRLFQVTVVDVQAWRDLMVEEHVAHCSKDHFRGGLTLCL